MNGSTIKVLLVDDHALVRAGLKRVLEEAPDIDVVAEASDGKSALIEYARVGPEVVVLDISMPGMDGLETTKKMINEHSDARILILTVYPEDYYAARVIRAGALGYITKGTSTYELHDSVRNVANRQRSLSQKTQEILLMQLFDKNKNFDSLKDLSDREFQVLSQLAKGLKTREIASNLDLSVKTIETYRARLLNKLELHTNLDIVRFAYQHKLV
jgi:DNA-binding NarL/FixJ family response regulator